LQAEEDGRGLKREIFHVERSYSSGDAGADGLCGRRLLDAEVGWGQGGRVEWEREREM
jgi:hypothetical protein